MTRSRAKLAVVPRTAAPEEPKEPPTELGLYAETRAVADDVERWRRLHVRSDRSPAIVLAHQARRIFAMKGGVRRERGGHKFEERP
jgi:hypothetical protein